MPDREPFDSFGALPGAEGGFEEERIRRQADYIAGREPTEILRLSDNSRAIRWAMRSVVAGQEGQKVTERPNSWVRSSMMEILESRRRMSQMRLLARTSEGKAIFDEFGLGRILFGTIADKRSRVSEGAERLSRDELVELQSGLAATAEELEARWYMLEAVRQHLQAQRDLEEVTVKVFTAGWKIYPEAVDFGVIANAPESLPGAEKLGVMVDKGMRLWCDIGEGVGEAKEEGVPNIFGEGRYRKNYQLALEFVAERLLPIRIKAGVVGDKKGSASPYWQDALDAARLSYLMCRVLDLDVAKDMTRTDIPAGEANKWERGLKAFLLHSPSADEGDYDFEGGMNSGDMAKLAWFILRQANEASKNRHIGAPATVGCFPNLTFDLMRLSSVKAETTETGLPKVELNVNLWKLWRELGIPLGELPWSSVEWKDGVRVLINKGIIPADQANRQWRVEGINEDFIDVPGNLQRFFAVVGVFNEITRKDGGKQLEEFQDPNAMMGKNKAFDTAFGLMGPATGLSKEILSKITRLTKINVLIGVLVANLPDNLSTMSTPANEFSVQRQMTPAPVAREAGEPLKPYERLPETIVNNVLFAATRGKFLTNEADDRDRSREEAVLLARAVGKYGLLSDGIFKKGEKPTRRGFLPSESGWFSEKELDEIRQSGLYAPYNKV